MTTMEKEMSNEIKMAEVFELPVKVKKVTGEKSVVLINKQGGKALAFCQFSGNAEEIAYSINNHDRLTTDLAEARAETDRLRDYCMIILESIDGGGKVVTFQDHHIDELRELVGLSGKGE